MQVTEEALPPLIDVNVVNNPTWTTLMQHTSHVT